MSIYKNGVLETGEYIPKFIGKIWYVNKESGSDSNSGEKPDLEFETIGAAITTCSAGDAIDITAGTYSDGFLESA